MSNLSPRLEIASRVMAALVTTGTTDIVDKALTFADGLLAAHGHYPDRVTFLRMALQEVVDACKEDKSSVKEIGRRAWNRLQQNDTNAF